MTHLEEAEQDLELVRHLHFVRQAVRVDRDRLVVLAATRTEKQTRSQQSKSRRAWQVFDAMLAGSPVASGLFLSHAGLSDRGIGANAATGRAVRLRIRTEESRDNPQQSGDDAKEQPAAPSRNRWPNVSQTAH
jgi:hypothetical protein